MRNMDAFYQALAQSAASLIRSHTHALPSAVRLSHVEEAMDTADLAPEDLRNVNMPEFINYHLRPALRQAMHRLVDDAATAVEYGIDDALR